MPIKRIVAAAIFVGGASFAMPMMAQAQTPSQVITISAGDIGGHYRVLGVVRAKYHQKSMFPSKSAQESLNDALRAEASKLGADAVIQVRYTMVNNMTSKEGHSAEGVAVKFEAAQGVTTAAAPPVVQFGPTEAKPQVMASAAPAAQPSAPAPVAPAAVASAPVASAPAVVSPGPAIAVTPPALASAPMMSPLGAPAALPAAPAAPVAVAAAAPAPAPAIVAAPPPPRARTADMVLISEQDIISQGYEKLGEVSVRYHQKSIFPKNPPRVELESKLKAEAFKLGADAVILTKFKFVNSMTTKEGHSATGVAVRLK